MLRVPLALSLSLALSACSLGYVALPVAQQPAAAEQAASTGDSDRMRMASLGGPVGSIPTPDKQAASAQSAAAEALDMINKLRIAKGLAPLAIRPELTRAAEAHASNLARLGTLTHTGQDGSTPLDRVRRAGYQPRMAAENIAGGQPTPAEAVASWRASETHLRNLLLPDALHAGFAQASDPRAAARSYWTLVVAAPL